jgi:membrane protease YdiL (CAAX protease family)
MADPQQDAPVHVGYLDEARSPLQSLLFLTPLILAYEAGLIAYGTDAMEAVSRDIYARRLLHGFFEWFGLSGYYLPGLIVVVVLLVLHVVQRLPWRFTPRYYVYMGAESVAVALPLFVFSILYFRMNAAPPQVAAVAPESHWQSQIVFGIGAGIYEELLFRLVALALLHAIFFDFLRRSRAFSDVAAICISAAAFGIYHFSADNPFQWYRFAFYLIAGVYFAGLYLARGFGITAGTHATYDVMVVLFRLWDQD